MLMTQKHTHKKMLAYAYAYGYAYEPSLCRAQREKNNHIFFFNFGSIVANYLNSFILSFVRFETG